MAPDNGSNDDEPIFNDDLLTNPKDREVQLRQHAKLSLASPVSLGRNVFTRPRPISDMRGSGLLRRKVVYRVDFSRIIISENCA
jgi:hypothetical protein